MMSTAWPWPYPVSDARHPHAVPKLTVFMNRADPSNFRDGTGWGYLGLADGHFVKRYELWRTRPASCASTRSSAVRRILSTRARHAALWPRTITELVGVQHADKAKGTGSSILSNGEQPCSDAKKY